MINPLRKHGLLHLIISLLLLCLLVLFTPLERTLGVNTRLVFFHGALVWVAIILFILAGLAGLYGLIVRRENIHLWSRALGHMALLLWFIFLPMSLVVMQDNWNGIFLAEPRFRIPLNFAVVGLLLQIGLLFLPVFWTSITNLLFAASLAFSLSKVQSVLHPVSPIFHSDTLSIPIYFSGIFLILIIISMQMTHLWRNRLEKPIFKKAH